MRFSRKQKTKQVPSIVGQKIRSGLLYLWNKARQHFANYLSKKTANVSYARLKNYLLLFCIICSAISTFLLIHPFISGNSTSPVVTSQIRFPIHAYRPNLRPVPEDSIITYHKHQRILQFEGYLDSLKYSAVSRNEYDSIMKLYPGLRDSITHLKQLYQNQ